MAEEGRNSGLLAAALRGGLGIGLPLEKREEENPAWSGDPLEVDHQELLDRKR